MKKHKTILTFAIYIAVFALCFLGAYKIYKYATVTEQHEYELSEIQDGIYVLYQQTISATPAHNYEIATFCSNGVMMTIKGDVNFIIYDDKPIAKIKSTPNMVNCDFATFYINKDMVEYLPTISVR